MCKHIEIIFDMFDIQIIPYVIVLLKKLNSYNIQINKK